MLTKLLETLLSNAATVTVLAVVVYALAKCIRHQGVVHGLWIVVLVKLITPAIVTLPFAITVDNSWLTLNADEVLASWSTGRHDDADSGLAIDGGKQSSGVGLLSRSAEPDVGGTTTRENPEESGLTRTWSWSRAVVSVLILAWLLGTCFYVVRLLIRYVRFCRFLGQNEQVDEELISEGYDLAYKMGLKRPPRVRVLSGAFSPMLCGFGRSLTLILPLDLLHRLTPKGRATLIVHELAHYSRGDYLVRVLETFVTAIYWWHPAVWWVRRELEIVEEDCVDARVVSEFPGDARHYAEAILDAIDILCERTVVMPPLASGLGSAPMLKRRLTRIMTETEVPVTTRRGYVTVLASAALVLPLQMIDFKPEESTVVKRSVAAGLALEDPSIVAVDCVSQQQIEDALSQANWCKVRAPDGDWTLLADANQKCRLVSARQRRIVELAEASISCVVFSPDSQWLAAGASDGTVFVLRAPDWKLIQQTIVGAAVKAIDVSSDARRLAVCTNAGDIRVLNTERLNCVTMRRLPMSSPNCIRFSPDDTKLIVGCGDWRTEMDSAMLLMDSQSLQLSAAMNLTSPVALARFGQCEDELITCDWSGQLTLWKLPDLLILNTQWIPKDIIAPMAFSVQTDDTNVQFRQEY